MKYLITTISLLLFTQVQGFTAPRTIHVPSWDLEITPGGEVLTLNGTVQEVHTELLKLNPNWDTDFNFGESASPTLTKRTRFDPSMTTYCRGRFPIINGGDYGAINEGIRYLHRVPGTPRAPKGRPGWCSRVSCSYNVAIIWCNDEPAGKSLSKFGSIADGAQYIFNTCANADGVSGQVFHPTKWNVILQRQRC